MQQALPAGVTGDDSAVCGQDNVILEELWPGDLSTRAMVLVVAQ